MEGYLMGGGPEKGVVAAATAVERSLTCAGEKS